ncbi:MAG: PTS sugar transporter subunit IIA [Elusimicrobia bacterium]|nr:PTS sugar transporter subunit IIA [Elusimicrobiota bacterium]
MTLGWFKKKVEPEPPVPRPAPSVPPVGAPAARKSLSIGPLLREDLVVIPPTGLAKDALIGHLVKDLCAKANLGDPAPFLAKVLEREQGISTTLDTGLAVPHARMDGLAEIAAILGIVPGGLPDPKQTDLSIRAVFLFFSPNRQEAFTQHLHLLRGVSTLFQPALIEAIIRDPAPASVIKAIRDKEAGA